MKAIITWAKDNRDRDLGFAVVNIVDEGTIVSTHQLDYGVNLTLEVNQVYTTDETIDVVSVNEVHPPETVP